MFVLWSLACIGVFLVSCTLVTGLLNVCSVIISHYYISGLLHICRKGQMYVKT